MNEENKTTSIVKIEQLERSLLHELAEHDKTRRRLEAQEREIERMRTNIYKDRVSGPLANKNMWTKEKPTEPCLCFVYSISYPHFVCSAMIVADDTGLMLCFIGTEELTSLDEFTWFYMYDAPEPPPEEEK